MNLTIDQSLLVNTLALVERATRKTAITPVQGMVVLTATKNRDSDSLLGFQATDGNVGIDTRVPADVKEGGKVAVSAHGLVSCANAMSRGSKVKLEIRGDRLRMVAGDRSHTMKTLDLDKVSPLPEPQGAKSLRIKSEMVQTIIERMGYLVPLVPEEHKYRKGILLNVDKNKATAVVIAGHMTGLFAAGEVKASFWECLLPDAMLGLLEKVAAEQEQINLEYTTNVVWAVSDRTLLCCMRTAEDYPPWRQMFAEVGIDRLCDIGRLGLIDSIGAVTAGISSMDTRSPLVLDFQRENKSLLLSCSRSAPNEQGEGRDTLPVECERDQIVHVNHRYLLETAKASGYDGVLSVHGMGPGLTYQTSEGFLVHMAGIDQQLDTRGGA
jgi:DNA polymerase III sliding clamp (beta) subunit (PCNA family)